MTNSRMQDIFLHLKKEGFEVYFPGRKQGECTSRYVVVKPSSTNKLAGYSSTVTYYDLLCYIPQDEFSQLEEFIRTIKTSMEKLVPMIRPTYMETTPYLEEGIKAYMVSLQYQNYRKI